MSSVKYLSLFVLFVPYLSYLSPICVLSLLIERAAEIACQQPWSQIRRKLQTLQVTEFLTLKHGFYRRNELTPEVSQTLKTLAVSVPKSILAVENLS